MRRFVILIAFITALAVPAQALAAGTAQMSPSAAGVHQYHRTIPTPEGVEPPPPAVQPPSPGQLPFTGEDVLLVILTGALLAGAGLTLYRQARQR